MKITVRIFMLTGVLLLALTVTGCYTVLMIPEGRSTTAVRDYESYYEDEADTESEYSEDVGDDEVPVEIHKHYYYGDAWTDYVIFDPFYDSPYWWYYDDWYYGHHMCVFDPYYSWHWRPWRYAGYYGWGYQYPYYSHIWYHDPYYTYYDHYYGGYQHAKWMDKQPFEERTRYSVTAIKGSQPVSGAIAKGGYASGTTGGGGTTMQTGEQRTIRVGNRNATITKTGDSGGPRLSTQATDASSRSSSTNRSSTSSVRKRSQTSSSGSTATVRKRSSSSSSSSSGTSVRKRSSSSSSSSTRRSTSSGSSSGSKTHRSSGSSYSRSSSHSSGSSRSTGSSGSSRSSSRSSSSRSSSSSSTTKKR